LSTKNDLAGAAEVTGSPLLLRLFEEADALLGPDEGHRLDQAVALLAEHANELTPDEYDELRDLVEACRRRGQIVRRDVRAHAQ